MTNLRLITYLAPGIPMEFFETIARALGPETVLVADSRASGPPAGETDPFTAGTADLGFMCAPAFLSMRRGRANPPVRLLGVAPVFDDPRAKGQPVYHADVIVRAADEARSFTDLRSRRVGYNDAISLSGRLALLIHLAEIDEDLTFFSEAIGTGSHDASLRALHDHEIDVATIDATTLRLRQAARDPLVADVRVVAALGPHPIQPIVLRSDVEENRRRTICAALVEFAAMAEGRVMLAQFGCIGFAPVSDHSYSKLDASLLSLDIDCWAKA